MKNKKHANTSIKTQSEFREKLIRLTLPIAFQQFMLTLVSASDAVMLGMLTQDSLSAVSLATQVTFIFNLFLATFTTGTSMLAAQYWGRGDKEAIEKILGFVLDLSIVTSFLFFLATFFAPEFLMRIFTNQTELIPLGADYLRMASGSYLLCGISQIYLCILKNSNLAVRTMVISSVTVLVNLFLNAIFIFGIPGTVTIGTVEFSMPSMGIGGAALATTIARAFELIWVIIEAIKKDRIHIRFHYMLHIDTTLFRDFIKYTTPVLANELAWGCGFAMSSVIMGHLDSDAVAANSIANIVKNLAACFGMGLANGGSIIVGNALGAGDLVKGKEYGRKLCQIAILTGVITGVFILLLMPAIIKFTALSPQAQKYLQWILLMSLYYMVGRSINTMTISGIFCAGGDSRFGFICDAVTMWVVIVPIASIAAFILKAPTLVVYFILSMDEMVKLPAVYLHYKKYHWVKNLTRSER